MEYFEVLEFKFSHCLIIVVVVCYLAKTLLMIAVKTNISAH